MSNPTQTPHIRSLGPIVYTAGGRQVKEIDRDGVLLDADLRIRFTVTNGATGPVGPLFQTLARAVRRLEVIVGGRDTVWSIGGAELAARHNYEFLLPSFGLDDAVVLTANATTTYDIILHLPFYLPGGRREDDTALDLRNVSQASIAVTWGDANDLFKTPNGATISNVTCNLTGRYLLGAPATAVYMVRTLDMVEQQVTGSTPNFKMVLDRQSGVFYRSFHAMALLDNVANDGIMDAGGIKVEAGSFVFQNRESRQVKAQNKREFGLAALTGNYFIPLTTYGQATQMINTALLTSDLTFSADVTMVAGTPGVNMLRVVREAVRPLKLV